MRTAVLLGSHDTKRTIYFEKAARRIGLPFLFLDWEEWRRNGFSPAGDLFLKIDPPIWQSCHLTELNAMVDGYREDLKALEQEPAISRFLNPPRHILALLDKAECKRRLSAAGLPVTEMLGADITCAEELICQMRERRVFQVFLKPITGSGAAGVTAFRFQPSTGRMAAYSCAFFDCETKPGRLVNTKRLRTFINPDDILPLLDGLLSIGCIVERWYPKAGYRDFSYDLRAVYQEGRLDFLLARLSKGPITNLHLNNHPLEASKLGLPVHVTASIEELCGRALQCYPGLGSAGIDILLECGSLRPRIIEINGQGDLLYQDIFQENRIYLHQAEMMADWLKGTDHERKI